MAQSHNMTENVANVLASRYASTELVDIWCERGKVLFEREFWIAVLKAQRDLGVNFPDDVISAYEDVKDQINLESIRQREITTRHDVKARIDEFCDLAGHEHIHKGMTSRDLTDNVEQFQILRSLKLLAPKYVFLLDCLRQRSQEWQDLVVVGRTHHAAAQPTTLGKRIAMFGQEMLLAFSRLEQLIERYPLRGLQGAVGTGLDQLTLLDGNVEKLSKLQQNIVSHLGFQAQLNAVGQIYPRSLDFEVVSCLYQLGGGVANLARTLRLMAGAEVATEGFLAGQVGSSAMPHKMNTRSSERINGLEVVLSGYVQMTAGLVGDQWFEGDVSCSVVRRVALPDAFFALDGIIETSLHVVDEMGIYPVPLQRELDKFMPFLATTTLLMQSVQRGAGREHVHEAIREHAINAALKMRQGENTSSQDLINNLGLDERIPLTISEIKDILSRSHDFVGVAINQVDRFSKKVEELVRQYPQAKDVEKNRLL